MNDDLMVKANQIAIQMNYKLHAAQFDIPMFNFMKKTDSPYTQVVFVAEGGGYIEQLVSDGHINDGEFEQRVDLVISNTKKVPGVQIDFFNYKDYSNGIFNFKLYFQDMIIPTSEGNKISRSINAYFVEPKMHDFYQFSLSTEPLLMPTKELKPGVIDLENDKLTLALNNLMKDLLDNLKYKN